ncbi:MAG: hypothetical protein MJZ15_10345 [Bacteroidales bacterium]|nr:hypothetical protein [Bacteroidales bacterium]
MKKRCIIIIGVLLMLLAEIAVTAQTTSERDSINYYLAQEHYSDGKIALCVDECKSIIKLGTYYATDAKVLLALCRERQGFERAAIRLYKQLIRKDKSAMGAYCYASNLYRRGYLNKAMQTAQTAIKYDKNLPEAHLLLGSVMASKCDRFKAMMPLYYFMLINDDAEKQKLAYDQVISLWRRSSQTMQLLKTDVVADPFNDKVNRYINGLASNDSIAKVEGREQIEMLKDKTDALLRYLLENSEDNLDFWQVYYTDFMVKLVPRNFVKPFVYFISDKTHHAQVLEWISGEEGDLFNEFRLWMEAQ